MARTQALPLTFRITRPRDVSWVPGRARVRVHRSPQGPFPAALWTKTTASVAQVCWMSGGGSSAIPHPPAWLGGLCKGASAGALHTGRVHWGQGGRSVPAHTPPLPGAAQCLWGYLPPACGGAGSNYRRGAGCRGGSLVWFGSPYGIIGYHSAASSRSPCSRLRVARPEAAASSLPSPASSGGGGGSWRCALPLCWLSRARAMLGGTHMQASPEGCAQHRAPPTSRREQRTTCAAPLGGQTPLSS